MKEKEMGSNLSSLSCLRSSELGSVTSFSSIPLCDAQVPSQQSPSVPVFTSRKSTQFSSTKKCYNKSILKPSDSAINDKKNPVAPSHSEKRSHRIPCPPSNKECASYFAFSLSSPISEMRFHIANNIDMTQKKSRSREEIINNPDMQKKFEKVTALAKGFLTRLLWNSQPVQTLVTGIRVAAQEMINIKGNIINNGQDSNPTEEDIRKQREIVVKVAKMDNMLAYIFFGMTVKERMGIIAESRSTKPKQRTNTVTCVTQKKASSTSIVNNPKVPSPTITVYKHKAPSSTTTVNKHKVSSPTMVVNKHKVSSATLKTSECKKTECKGSNQDDFKLEVIGTKKPLHERRYGPGRRLI